MNKNNIITLIRVTFISVCLTVSGIAVYQIFFTDLSEFAEGGLTGLTVGLLLIIPLMFSKKGLFVKRMYKYDERELIISIIANYLTLLVLLFGIVIFFINHINDNTLEISYPLLTIKMLFIVGFKFYMNHILRKFL